MKSLTLPEHLLLLALNDDNGAVVQSSALALPYGLNGALIMELSLRGRVRVEENLLVEISNEPTGDDILDEALITLENCDRDRSAEFWIARPDSLVSGLKQRLLDRLVERGILRHKEHRFLWLLPYDRYPSVDGETERDLRQLVHDVVLRGAEADESTALLVSLVHACGLEKEVFENSDAADVKAKLNVFSEGTQVAKAVTEEVATETIGVVLSSIMSTLIPTIKTR